MIARPGPGADAGPRGCGAGAAGAEPWAVSRRRSPELDTWKLHRGSPKLLCFFAFGRVFNICSDRVHSYVLPLGGA